MAIPRLHCLSRPALFVPSAPIAWHFALRSPGAVTALNGNALNAEWQCPLYTVLVVFNVSEDRSSLRTVQHGTALFFLRVISHLFHIIEIISSDFTM